MNIKYGLPFEFFKYFSGNKIISNFLNRKDKKVLDLGCNLTTDMFILFHDFGFKRLFGIENESFTNIVKKESLPSQIKTPHDYYLSYLTFDEEDIKNGMSHVTEREFNKHFEFKFETDIKDFIISSKDSKFDLITLSNVLHLMPRSKAQWIVKHSMELLTEGGLIFIKVNHKDNEIQAQQRRFDVFEFKQLVKDYIEILTYSIKNDSNEKIKSLIFIGQSQTINQGEDLY